MKQMAFDADVVDGLSLEEFVASVCSREFHKWLLAKTVAGRAAAGPRIIGPGAPDTNPALDLQQARQALISAAGEAIRSGRYRLRGIPAGAHAPVDIAPDLVGVARIRNLSNSAIFARGRIFDCVRIADTQSAQARGLPEPTVPAVRLATPLLTPSEQLIHDAVITLWPDGFPVGLRAQQRNIQIVEFFQRKTGRPVDDRTIKRYFKKMKPPVPKSPRLSLVAP
jgi:hypothetical protein